MAKLVLTDEQMLLRLAEIAGWIHDQIDDPDDQSMDDRLANVDRVAALIAIHDRFAQLTATEQLTVPVLGTGSVLTDGVKTSGEVVVKKKPPGKPPGKPPR